MGFWGVTEKKTALKGGPSKKIREKGGHVKYYLYCRGGRRKKFSYWGRVMQLSNDTSKNSTSPPYLVKSERSLSALLSSEFPVLLLNQLIGLVRIARYSFTKHLKESKDNKLRSRF